MVLENNQWKEGQTSYWWQEFVVKRASAAAAETGAENRRCEGLTDWRLTAFWLRVSVHLTRATRHSLAFRIESRFPVKDAATRCVSLGKWAMRHLRSILKSATNSQMWRHMTLIPAQEAETAVLCEFKVGWVYIWSSRPVRAIRRIMSQQTNKRPPSLSVTDN